MKGIPVQSRPRLAWIALCTLLICFTAYPVSSKVTRATFAALLVSVWIGAITLAWPLPRRRWAVLGFTIACASLLLLPAHPLPDPAALREGYVAGLRRYQGVRYIWGGESFTGIDCSGLIRRGLIDSLFLRGLRTLDGGLVRQAISLWTHDCSAEALGQGYRQLTVPVLDTPSLNALDYAQILPGDLAVTGSGVHIMAYAGDKKWIEADPVEGKVIVLSAPSRDNEWLNCQMHIVRWSLFTR